MVGKDALVDAPISTANEGNGDLILGPLYTSLVSEMPIGDVIHLTSGGPFVCRFVY